MDFKLDLTEAQIIALELIGNNTDLEQIIQKVVTNLTDRQIDIIVQEYVNNKLENNARMGFTNKTDLVISAKNEGFIKDNMELLQLKKM